MQFGEEVKLLHPFEQPFSDAAGARIIDKFSFEDEQPDAVLKLMSSVVPMLEHARNGATGGGDNVQIVFVISDAVFQNPEKVREWVSEAAAKQQLIVFIIVDNPPKKNASVLGRISRSLDPLNAALWCCEFCLHLTCTGCRAEVVQVC